MLLGLSLAGCGAPESITRGLSSLVSSVPGTDAPAPDKDSAPSPWPPDDGTVCPAEYATDPNGDCAMTLEAAIQLSLERNVDLYNRRQTRKEEKLQFAIDENPWRPEFSASATTNANRDNVTGSLNLTTSLKVPSGGTASLALRQPLYGDDGESQSLTFSQPLFQRPSNAPLPDDQEKIKAFEDLDLPDAEFARDVILKRLEEQKKNLDFRKYVADLVNKVIAAYRGLNGAIRQVEISAESLERAREQRTRTQALIQAGRVAAREAGRADSAIANAELALERARTAEDRAQTTLSDLLELDDTLRIRPLNVLQSASDSATLPLDMETPDLEDILPRRTDYLSAVIATTQAEETLAKLENDLLPDVNLTFTVPFNGLDKKPSLGIGATFPLSNRRQRELDLLKARNGLAQAERTLIKTRTQIGRDLRQAVNDVAMNRRLTELAQAARELAANNLEIEEFKFAQGLSSATDLAQAEQELARAEESEKDAVVATLNALDRLDTTTGRTLERWGIAVEELEP